MYIYPLDKQIEIAAKILHLLEIEKVTFSEFGFINDIVNDSIQCQKEDIEYPDFYHYSKKIKADDPKDKIIRYTGNIKFEDCDTKNILTVTDKK